MGDYLYEDWNGDGWINDLDVHPIGYTDMVPMVNFGLTISASWKGIDFSMLWQGSGNRYIIAREFLQEPLWSRTNAISEHMDRWHPADPTANPYLAFSALLMAGLDGIQNKIHPGEAADKNLYDLPPEENAKIPTVCSSLDQALEYLDRDREFLTRGGVFSNDFIDA